MPNSLAEIQTTHATRYLTQLCKHFEHKLPVHHDGATGDITFGVGTCRLRADAGTLTLALDAADASAMAQLKDVVVRHLVRFAFREELSVNWQSKEAVLF